MKVLYIPIDERPCNYEYPQYLAGISGEVELIVPPREYMGCLKEPADIKEIWTWIFNNIKDCSYAIMSVDTLVYGNIINSRIHNRPLEECKSYIENFKKVKDINPSIEVHAFNLVTRVSNSNSDAEDPSYWKTEGENIWLYCCLTDKIKRGHSSRDEEEKLESLKKTIPPEYLKDFLKRRETNRYINLKCLEFTKAGIIDRLVIPKDDCSEYGFAAMDQDIIGKSIFEHRIMDRVMVYPGADEVGCVLFARIFNRKYNFVPKIFVKYSSTLGAYIIPKYEDRPLNESIKSQITSLGGILVNEESEADFLLAVHTMGKEMTEALDQNKRDVSYHNYSNISEFLRYIQYFSERYKKPYAIADVAFANGADNEFMVHANMCGILENACAYGGWNTAQNTIGVVLAQAALCSYHSRHTGQKYNRKASKEFLLRKIIEDWFLLTKTLGELVAKRSLMPRVDPYHVGEYEETVKNIILDYLQKFIDEEFGGRFDGKRIAISNISLPWHRVFEIDFDLKLV